MNLGTKDIFLMHLTLRHKSTETLMQNARLIELFKRLD